MVKKTIFLSIINFYFIEELMGFLYKVKFLCILGLSLMYIISSKKLCDFFSLGKYIEHSFCICPHLYNVYHGRIIYFLHKQFSCH